MIAHILPCHLEAEAFVLAGYLAAYGRGLLASLGWLR